MDTERQNKPSSKLKAILTIISLILSIFAFIFATFPQFNPFNTNPIEKANAGHSKSQMFLAHHYYEIGDIEESYYWYKIASATNGKYKAIALNNLAYLELTFLKSNDVNINYLDKAFKVLDDSAELGEKTALENLYILLVSNDEKFFSDIEYRSKLGNIEKQINAESINVSDYSKYKGNWKYIETCTNASSVPPNTNEYRFILKSSDYVYSSANNSFEWIYTYDVYKLNKNVMLPEYIYIDDF